MGLNKKNFQRFVSKEATKIDTGFISDVIHKIKNGLGGIGGFAALIDRDMQENDPNKRLIKSIQDGVKKVNEIAITLMMIVRDLEPNMERIELKSFFKEIRIPKEYTNSGRGYIIKPEINNGSIKISADPDFLQKMILYMIRFIEKVEAKVDRIFVDVVNKKRCCVEFYVSEKDESVNLDENLSRLIKSSEPLEARLYLGVAEKLVKLFNGDIYFESSRKGDKRFIIRFNCRSV